MQKLKDKKQYPSQLNSKSVACRIPITDYVEIVNECVDKGINVNDWLLTKIYGNGSNSIGVNNGQNSDDWEITNYDFGIPEEVVYNPFIPPHHEIRFYMGRGWFKGKQRIIETLYRYIEEAIELRNKVEELENELVNRVANINDVKNQLTILIDNKFDNVKDRREFRNDILPLLKELE